MLLGLSRNMEKSLSNIEKLLKEGKDPKGKESGSSKKTDTSISSGILSLSSSVKNFDSAKGKAFVSFAEKLTSVISTIKPQKAEAFSEFGDSISKTIDTIIGIVDAKKLLQLTIGSKILFGTKDGKDSLLTKIIKGISNSFKDIDSDSIKEGSEAIKLLGKGLSSLTTALKSFAIIGLLAPLVAIGALVTWGVLKLFKNLGDHSKSYESGGKALGNLGKGLIAFSAGLATLMLVVTLVTPIRIIEGIAVIASFALVFATLGQVGSYIEKGGKSIAFMGLGLFAFSASLATYMLVIMMATPKLVIEGIAVLGLIAAAFAGIGFLDKGGMIKSGGESMLFVGEGLLAVSVGLLAFSVAMKFVDEKTALIGPMVLLGLGLVFTAIGGDAELIAPGAAAMTTVGVALLSISAGILVFGLALKGLQAIFGNDLASAGLVSGGILLGLGVAFSVVGSMSAMIAPGAAAMITVGFSLLSISAGILVFGLSLKGLKSIFPSSEGGIKQAAETSGKILLSLGLAFAGLGVVSIAIIPGAAAGIAMGVSLLSMSAGIWIFGKTVKSLYDNKVIDDDGNMKGVGILSQMMKEFASMAITSFFALPGIAASIAMGVSLITISKGLNDVQDSIKKLDNSFVDKLFDSDTGIIYGLAKGFETIGNKFSGGFLSNWMGSDPVSLGVRTVRGFGDTLQDIAGGIVAFASFDKFPIKIVKDGKIEYGTTNVWEQVGKIQKNLIGEGDGSSGLLYTLSSIFASIGEKFGAQGMSITDGVFSLGKESPTQKGIDAIHGLGSVLSELAGGLAAFANLQNFPIKKMAGGKLIDDVINVFDIIPAIQKALIGDGNVTGKVTGNSGILFALANIFASIGEKYGAEKGGWFGIGKKDSPVGKGVEAVKGLGGVLNDLAKGILGFAEMERGLPNYDKDGKLIGYGSPVDLNKVKTKIEEVLNIIPSVFANIKEDDYKKYKDSSETLSSLGTNLSSFANSIKSISVDKDSVKMLNNLYDPINKFSNMGDGLEKFAGALAKSGSSFGKFTNVVNSFDIEKLKLTESMMKSISIISKSPDSLAQKMSDTLEKSFEELIKAIKELSNANSTSKSPEPVPQASSPLSALAQPTAPTPVNTQKDSGSSIKTEELIELLTKSMSTMQADIASMNRKFISTSDGIKVNPAH